MAFASKLFCLVFPLISLTVLLALPGVLAGSLLLLWITDNTLNIQSFMGCIMAIGVAVSDVILLVSNAEQIRLTGNTGRPIFSQAAANRFRPIIMTSSAMIVGMLPMSLGLGEGGKQTAPLAIAVIGGLLFSMFISLFLVPLIYDLLIGNKKPINVSLDPDDETSLYFDRNA